MNEAVIVEDHSEIAEAKAIVAKLQQIKEQNESNWLDLCALLYEANERKIHHLFGYTQFSDWIETGSGLGMSARNAWYFITIQAKALKLGLTRDQLKECNVSKLKEIMSLDPSTHADEMKTLVNEAPYMTIEEVKEAVARLKCKDGDEPPVYMTLKLTGSVKEVVQQAFEIARMHAGSNETEIGPQDISDSRCIEYICADFISGFNKQ